MQSMGYAWNWSFAVRSRSVLRTPMKSAPCASELVFREVPGKSVQRRGRADRFGGLILVALGDSMGGRVAGVAGAPTGLRLLAASFLAVRFTASALAVADSHVWPEPPSADPARSLPGIGHARSSSPPTRWSTFGEHWWVSSRERRRRCDRGCVPIYNNYIFHIDRNDDGGQVGKIQVFMGDESGTGFTHSNGTHADLTDPAVAAVCDGRNRRYLSIVAPLHLAGYSGAEIRGCM